MHLELYFLRSFEHEIATELLHYAAGLDETDQTLDTHPYLEKYYKNYGLYATDIGVYAMVDNKVAGAAWVRMLKGDHEGNNRGLAFVDDQTPELVIGVKPPYRNKGIGTVLMQQLLTEVGFSYKQLALAVESGSAAYTFFEKLGFVALQKEEQTHPLSHKPMVTMLKQIERSKADNSQAEWFEKTQKWRMPDA